MTVGTRDAEPGAEAPEQRSFEAARSAMYNSQRRLAEARALITRPGLSWEQRQQAMSVARVQAAATRLAVKAFCYAADQRNQAEARRRG